MSRGRLITIEGIDGAGKSTLAVGLRDALADRGVDIRLLREPGGVPASERIREVVIDPDLDEFEDMDQAAEHLAETIAWHLWPIMLPDRGVERLVPVRHHAQPDQRVGDVGSAGGGGVG